MAGESDTYIYNRLGSPDDEVVDTQWEKVHFLIGIFNFLRILGD